MLLSLGMKPKFFGLINTFPITFSSFDVNMQLGLFSPKMFVFGVRTCFTWFTLCEHSLKRAWLFSFMELSNLNQNIYPENYFFTYLS